MFDRLIFDPLFPLQAIVGLGGMVALLAIVGYVVARRGVGGAKKAVLSIVRFLAIAALTIVLMRPMMDVPEKENGEKPIFTILVDTSRSMNTRDVENGSRLGAVANRLRDAYGAPANDLGKYYDVQFYEFHESLLPGTMEGIAARTEAKGGMTDIARCLTGAASSFPLRKHAGMLLISDGRNNGVEDVAQAARLLKSRKIPVWTSTVGSASDAKDISVTVRLNRNFLYAKQPAFVRATLTQSGFQNWYAKVNLLREGVPVASKQIMLKDSVHEIEFPVKEEIKGLVQYTIEVEPLAGEGEVSNNRRTLFARVVDDKANILLIEARPYWDSKFLLRALREDPNIETTSIFRISETKSVTLKERDSEEGPNKRAPGDGISIPRTKDALYRYDCLIFGKGADIALSAEELGLLKDYLTERGGSIVFSRGKSYEGDSKELSALEPVVWDNDAVKEAYFELTPEGKQNPMFAFELAKPADVVVRELPAMVSITKILREKSLSVVLAKGKNEKGTKEIAVISYQRYGKGKVMSIGTAGLWRWAFMPDDMKEYDSVYKSFWSQMVRWLIDDSDFLPGQDISFRTSKYSFNTGERIKFTVATKHIDPKQYQPTIAISSSGGGSAMLIPTVDDPANPGIYSVTYAPETEGEFTAILRNGAGQPPEEKIRFTVYSDSAETRFVAVNKELMGQIANITGGEEIALGSLRELPAKARKFELDSRERARPLDIWDHALVFFAIVGLFAVEWFIRRRSGLV